jgi:hypothetical protein
MDDAKEFARAFEHAIALGRLDRDLVGALVEQIDQLSFRPWHVNWCIYGICLDYNVPAGRVPEFMKEIWPGLASSDRLQWLINGLPKPDSVNVRVIRDVRTPESPALEVGLQ